MAEDRAGSDLPTAARARLTEIRQSGTWGSALSSDEFAAIRSAGFEPASSADIVNGEIVLSAARNVVGDAFFDVAKVPPSSFEIQGGTYGSSIRGSATADFIAGSKGDLTVNGNLVLQGDAHAHLLDHPALLEGHHQAPARVAPVGGAPPGLAPLEAARGDALRAPGRALLQRLHGGHDLVAKLA